MTVIWKNNQMLRIVFQESPKNTTSLSFFFHTYSFPRALRNFAFSWHITPHSVCATSCQWEVSCRIGDSDNVYHRHARGSTRPVHVNRILLNGSPNLADTSVRTKDLFIWLKQWETSLREHYPCMRIWLQVGRSSWAWTTSLPQICFTFVQFGHQRRERKTSKRSSIDIPMGRSILEHDASEWRWMSPLACRW